MLSLNYGEQDTLLTTVNGKVGIKLDDQLCVGSGGDGLEELLQPSALEFLDSPLGGFKIFKAAVNVKFGLKKDFPLLTTGPGRCSLGA